MAFILSMCEALTVLCDYSSLAAQQILGPPLLAGDNFPLVSMWLCQFCEAVLLDSCHGSSSLSAQKNLKSPWKHTSVCVIKVFQKGFSGQGSPILKEDALP